jgi:hypothetical protein
MKNIFYIALLLMLGSLISCQEASFTAVDTPPPSEYWYTGEQGLSLNGRIKLHDNGGGYKPLPANAKIIVAWEMPNTAAGSLYIYGEGTIAQIGRDDYHFNVLLSDTLPKFILKNTDTTDAIAAAHIFLVSNLRIGNGDTMRYDFDWDLKYQMVGSMNGIGILFVKGNPVLPGQKPRSSMFSGYNILQAKRIEVNPPGVPSYVTDFEPAYPFSTEIEVDDDGKDCKMRTPFWLK